MNPEELLKSMTLEEKASMCSGGGYFTTQAVQRLDIPQVQMSDGPSGIRMQKGEQDLLGIAQSVPAVCYPSAVTQASTFHRELIYQLGAALGQECRAMGVGILLAPGINIKRSPLCGRNFEYFSEDPYLAGELGAEYVAGLQEQGVGACLKHFAVNSQEDRRMSVDAVVEERPLREIYLRAFERVIKKASPWSVMCAYNLLNGRYCSEHSWLLRDILREEWGFDGFTVTDWSAANRRVEALKAGLDLEMPASGGVRDRQIADAVQNGELDVAVLDQAVLRILRKVLSCAGKETDREFDKAEHYRLAEKIAEEGAVLLKNEGLLPLDKKQRIAFIGEFAEIPRYQGGGSSHVNCGRVPGVLEAAKKEACIFYAKGFRIAQDESDSALLEEAAALAETADAAVLFLGLPERYESEACDRTHLNLPQNQCELIAKICAVQEHVVAVLHNGSPVSMPWLDMVQAVITMNIGGQVVGEASFRLLYGMANPSGRLAETYPLRIEDTSCYLDYHKSGKKAYYHDSIYVGYRYYDAVKRDVLFPFGYGLSYSRFSYSDMSLNKYDIKQDETLEVKIFVENVSSVEGMEVIQLYVKYPEMDIPVSEKELRGFEKVLLKPKEKKQVVFRLKADAFTHYDTQRGRWIVKSGIYQIQIGQSSRDIVYQKEVEIRADTFQYFTADDTTTCGEVLRYSKNAEEIERLIHATDLSNTSMGTVESADQEAVLAAKRRTEEVLRNLPLHALISFSGGKLEEKDIALLISKINEEKNRIYD